MSAPTNVSSLGLELLSALKASSAQGFQQLDALMECFERGFPLEHLGALLEHADPRVVSAALYIVFEMGERASALIPKVVALTTHPMAIVRSQAVEAILNDLTPEYAEAFAYSVRAVLDTDKSVRASALRMMIFAQREWLEAALRAISPAEDVAAPLRWLLEVDDGRVQEIRTRLAAGDPVVRRFAAVAAGRFGRKHRDVLEHAALSQDEDIGAVAEAHLRRIDRRKTGGSSSDPRH